MTRTTTSGLSAPMPATFPAPGSHDSAWLRRAGLLLFIAALFVPALLFGEDRYWLPLFSRYMAIALFAVSVDLVWGYTGLLSLGQGLYFGLGAYMMGYSLKLRSAAAAADMPPVAGPDMAMPDFMAYCRLPAVPEWIAPLIDTRLALTLAVLLPAVVAGLFGLVVFSRRIKGVYFSLITQALVFAVFQFVVCQQPYTGGVVGMTNLAKLELFGQKFTMMSMYLLVTGCLSVCLLACWWLVHSKFGRLLTAIRDSETRVLALGYNAGRYKTFAFALAGAIAGLAGALYVSALGTTGPDVLGITFSIEIVIMVAVGGRGTLVGAALGAVLVALANTLISNMFKDTWPILLGGMFVLVVVFMPDGIFGFFRRIATYTRGRLHPASSNESESLS
jgi:urea transport system permease protein